MTVSTKHTDVKISPAFSIQDWLELDLTDVTSNDWAKAFKIFEDRINGRFLSQIAQLQKHPDKNIRGFSGFVIIALDCLLIETIEQFYNGVKQTTQGKSVDTFHSFFQKSSTFSLFFNTKSKSKVFYSQIRCGLLHQAQTQKKSTIHIKSGEPMLYWVDTAEIEEGLRIHRDKFHNEVVSIFKNYLNQLKSKSDKPLLDNFKKKMNIIAKQE